MATIVDHRSSVPDAPWYVLTNDSFMSGWGPAERKINTIILPCRSYQEAEAVAAYARSRSEQKHVRIVGEKPRLRSDVIYSLMNRSRAKAWYPREEA